MQLKISKLARIATSALFVAAFALPAAAEMHHHRHHHHHHHGAYNDRPLTVHGHSVVATGGDPYDNPAVIVTAPNAVAATVVGLPFRVAASVFPYEGSSPLVVIGAPVHAVGQIAEYPFYAIGGAFGAPPPANGIYY